jgi:hypothetical protein
LQPHLQSEPLRRGGGLDGFVITDDSPTAGKIAWADCNIVYKGTSYEIEDGNTDKKFVWWEADKTPTKFQSGDTKPELSDDDVLICINDGGAHQMVIGVGRMTPGSSILTGTVDSEEIANGAVLTNKIASAAITEGLLASGAVTVNKLGAGAVTSGKIANNAVISDKINTGAVTGTKLADGAVTGGKIAPGSVAENKLDVALHMLF